MTTPKQVQSKPGAKTTTDSAIWNNLKATVKANADLAKQQSATTTKATISAAKEVANLPANKDISYQILAEPISVFNPEAIINAGIAFVNTIGQAILGGNKDKLDKAAELSQNPDTKAQECIDKAGKKCSAIAQNNYKLGQLANGNNFTATFGQKIDTANSYSLSTDSNIDMKAPLFGVNSQDSIWVANNSIAQVADFKSGNYKQKVDFVEGSITSQSQNSTHIATETSTHVSKSIEVTGTQSASIKGKSTSVMGDSSIAIASGGTTNIASYDSASIQTNGDMFIGATRPNTLAKVAASNDSIGDTFLPSGGNITISSSIPKLAGTNADTSIFSLGDSGAFTSSTKSIASISEGISINYGKLANISATTGTLVNTNGKISSILSGRFHYTGRSYFPIAGEDIGVASLIDIPALPSLPQLPNKQLENCIPQNIKDKKASQDKLKQDLKDWKKGQLEEQNTIAVTPELNADTSNVPSASNPIQIPKSSTQNSTGNTNKLSQPSATNTKDSTAKVASWVTPISVLIEKYIKEKSLATLPNTYQDEFTLNTLYDFVNEDDFTTSLGAALVDLDSIVTNDFITSFVSEAVPNKVLDILQYPQFYLDLFKLAIEKVEEFTLTVEDFINADKDKVQSILNLVQEYPKLKEQILELVRQASAVTAIGGLFGLSGITSFINGDLVRNLSGLPKVIQSGNLTQIFTLAKPYLSKTLYGTAFENLLNNSDLIDFGQGVIKGGITDKLLKDTIDKVYNTKIKSVLESKAIDLLGSTGNTLFPLMKEVFNKVRIGEPIIASNYINEISSILSTVTGIEDINKATSVYNGIQGLLKDISEGDLLKVITGNNANSLISSVLGSENAGTISKVFDLVKDSLGAYESIKLIPDLLELMNDYKIPAIDQVNIALNCLDLFNKIKGLIDKVNALGEGSNKSTVALLENAGRMVQAANSINSVDDSTLDDWSNVIGDEYIDLQDFKVNLNTNLSLDKCFKVPKLNVFQSEVKVLQIENSALIFKLTNLKALQENFNLLPKVNELVQIRVQGFYSNSTRDYYVPYQTDYEYTPSVYSFVITSFDIENNIGVAYYDRAYSSIVLENSEGVLYKFTSEAIGITLSPDIIDSYLLA